MALYLDVGSKDIVTINGDAIIIKAEKRSGRKVRLRIAADISIPIKLIKAKDIEQKDELDNN